ncbi:MAG: hypothetical protein V1871_04455 [Planctomycetota bacterium]
MTQKQNLKLTLVLGLFFISLGGFLLHLRIHNPAVKAVNYFPFIIGLINIVIIPWLFLFRKWVLTAYLFNGLTVIFGIIFMAHFSTAHLTDFSFKGIVVGTLLADIIVLGTKFTLGKALFDLEMGHDPDRELRYMSLRYPNMGWWFIHLAGIALVYAIGAIVL